MIGGGNGLWGCGASGGECAGATFGEKQSSMVIAFSAIHEFASLHSESRGYGRLCTLVSV